MPSRIPPDQAAADMRAAGLEPITPYPGVTTEPWLCRCTVCDAEVTPRLSSIRSGNSGCRHCSYRRRRTT